MTGKYQIVLISDSTGETLGRIFLAIQSQFASFEYDKKEYVFIRTEQQIDKIINEHKEKKNTICREIKEVIDSIGESHGANKWKKMVDFRCNGSKM